MALVLILSSVIQLNFIWATVDIILGFVVFINATSLFLLFKYIKYLYNDYFRQIKNGNKEPEWDYETDIMNIGVTSRINFKNQNKRRKYIKK